MSVTILTGDSRRVLGTLPDGAFQCCVTSPPYFGLRDYGHADQMGLEPTPQEYVAGMVAVFREVRRVLREDGTLWLNLGDSYAGYHGNKNASYNDAPSNKGGYFENQRKTLVNHNGIKNKDLIGIPWRVAFALQDDGWYLRQDIIWHKPNPMPESVRDRCTKAHEYVFLLSKAPRYFYDIDAIREDPSGRIDALGIMNTKPGGREKRFRELDGLVGANRRSVWTIATEPFREAHYAVMPPTLAETCIKAGTKPGDHVLDPFGGAGTTGLVADRLQRNATLIELNPPNVEMARRRIAGDGGLFAEVS